MVSVTRPARRFICFTGIDGSGKSTLAHWLVSALGQHGIKSRYVYSRYQPMLAKPVMSIARIVFLHAENPFGDYDRYLRTRKGLFTSRLASKVYEYVMLFDYVIQTLVKVRVSLMLGQNLVCDRYIYDTIINDLALDVNYSSEKIEKLLNDLFLILPRPDIVFLVDVPEEIAYQRKNDIPSISYLERRRPLYLSIAKKHKLTILDGSRHLEELKSTVEKVVLGWL